MNEALLLKSLLLADTSLFRAAESRGAGFSSNGMPQVLPNSLRAARTTPLNDMKILSLKCLILLGTLVLLAGCETYHDSLVTSSLSPHFPPAPPTPENTPGFVQ
jgi:hypothetical protein